MKVLNEQTERLKTVYEPYSTIVAAYIKTSPEEIRLAIESVYLQTVPPTECILVCDGPMRQETDSEIHRLASLYPNLLVLRHKENLGTAAAVETASSHANYDLIEKMGGDDYCRPLRAELLLKEFSLNPNLAVVGGYLQAFFATPGDSDLIRRVPLDASSIRSFAKRRNPFNDGTTIYRKSVADAVGGYDKKLRRGQDYDLYVRIIASGYEVKNIPEILLDAREDRDAIRRRKSFTHLIGFSAVRWKLFRIGFSSFVDFCIPVGAQLLIQVLPERLADSFYEKFLRVHIRDNGQEK